MLPKKTGLWLLKWALTGLHLQGNSADGEFARGAEIPDFCFLGHPDPKWMWLEQPGEALGELCFELPSLEGMADLILY